MTKISRDLQQHNKEAVTNEHDKVISKERYTSPGERQQIIDKLRIV